MITSGLIISSPGIITIISYTISPSSFSTPSPNSKGTGNTISKISGIPSPLLSGRSPPSVGVIIISPTTIRSPSSPSISISKSPSDIGSPSPFLTIKSIPSFGVSSKIISPIKLTVTYLASPTMSIVPWTSVESYNILLIKSKVIITVVPTLETTIFSYMPKVLSTEKSLATSLYPVSGVSVAVTVWVPADVPTAPVMLVTV